MKDNLRKSIIVCLLFFAIYLGFKFICYNKYGPDSFLELSDIKISGNITINHENLTDEEYFEYKDIKTKNIFEGYEQNSLDTDSFLRMVKKVDSKISEAIFMGSERAYIDILKNDKEYKGIFNKIAEKENINNDIDLLKYMEKHNDDKVSFFTPYFKQRQIYTINEFKITMLPSIEHIKTLDGYYNGYMYKGTKDSIEAVVIKNNKRYFFTFLGNFSEEYVIDFMNSVVIE